MIIPSFLELSARKERSARQLVAVIAVRRAGALSISGKEQRRCETS